MRWLFVFSIAVIALKCSNALISSTVSPPQYIKLEDNKYKLCNWTVAIHCQNGSLIHIKNVTIIRFTCRQPLCTCPVDTESDAINLDTKGNIRQTIYDACQNQTTCETVLPEPKMKAGDNVAIVAVNYSCTGVPTTSTTTSESTETSSDYRVNRKDSSKQGPLLVAVSVTVPTILVIAVTTITTIICIRRKRRYQCPDDKAFVQSAIRNIPSDSIAARTASNNNTSRQNGGYMPGDYSEIELAGDINDSSEYNKIDFKTFKVTTSDPTYNHIGISSLGAMAASPHGGSKMTQDTDRSYATCGETEIVQMDNAYSRQRYPEYEELNAKFLAGTAMIDNMNSFRDDSDIGEVDDSYLHIVADEGDIRGKSIVKDVDNYSSIHHLAKFDEGTEREWKMQVKDEKAVSPCEWVQPLQSDAEDERSGIAGVGNGSHSGTNTHVYYILEKQF